MDGLKRSHIFAASIGNALAFYDFLTYALFAIQIGRAFFPSDSAYGSLMLSLATFGAGFVTRPIGAVVLGHYADRVGRRPAMTRCFLLLGGAIALMAIIPSYQTIGIAAPVLALLARMTQGFALGGEVGANTAFLAEGAHVRRRGYVVSWQGASQFIALIVGSLVGVALSALLTPSSLDAYGWRIAFLLGAATVPFGYWMRSRLPETLQAPAAGLVEGIQSPTHSELLGLVRQHARVMILGFLVLAAGTIGSYIIIYTVTYAQNTLQLPARTGFIAEVASYIVTIPAILLGGYLSDRYGRWPINVWSNLAFLVAIYPIFAWVAAMPSAFTLVLGIALLGGLGNFSLGSFSAGLAEALPQSIRSSGFATVYSVAMAAFGGTTQLVVTWLIHVTGSALAPAWYLVAATAIGQVALLLFPETAPVRQGSSYASAQAPAAIRPETL
ncbi:MAG TPA: MFS transporter [Steroidobacteraceae bacterium]|nr:MFS transporter [Steroidobacteraceae bacterium]